MVRNIQLVPRKNTFPLLYLSTFFFSFHHFFVAYYNSSFLATLLNEKYVGLIYVFGSLMSIFALILMPRILRKFGNFNILISLTVVKFLFYLGLAFLESVPLILTIFIIDSILLAVILLNFDVLLEHYTNPKNEGSVRGIFLTFVNVALILAPFVAGIMLGDGNYSKIYFISALLLIPFMIIIQKFRDFEDPMYHKIKIRGTLKCILKKKNLYNIFMTQFILRFFFSWMVIYMPIYLNTVIGFTWGQIGTMTAIILVPYVLFEYPAGKLADNYIGEKELLMLGFVIGGLATVYSALITVNDFLIWTIVLFIGRAGISLVEIMSESYFFKHVNEDDNNTIGFFRITRPVAYVVGPLIGTIFVALLPLQLMWLAIGLVLLSGVAFASQIEDTK